MGALCAANATARRVQRGVHELVCNSGGSIVLRRKRTIRVIGRLENGRSVVLLGYG